MFEETRIGSALETHYKKTVKRGLFVNTLERVLRIFRYGISTPRAGQVHCTSDAKSLNLWFYVSLSIFLSPYTCLNKVLQRRVIPHCLLIMIYCTDVNIIQLGDFQANLHYLEKQPLLRRG